MKSKSNDVATPTISLRREVLKTLKARTNVHAGCPSTTPGDPEGCGKVLLKY
jgi:hypothetical protein